MRNAVPDLAEELAERAVASRHASYADEVRRLLDAGFEVMARTGTLDPRVSDIVRTSGLSNQAFYRHFRGKDEFFLALLEDGRRRLLETIERRMARATDVRGRIRAWIEAVLAQAQDPDAATATRPFATNGERLGARFPDATRQSQARLVAPLLPMMAAEDAQAIYHLAMGSMHDALVARRVPSAAEVAHVVEFALKGADLERELLVTGIGGQGVQLAAQVLARGATLEGSNVMLFGVYAGAMRGMNTDATVVIGDGPLQSPPLVSHTWSAIGMHDKFWGPVARKLRPGALVLVNDTTFESPLPDDARVHRVPTTELAADFSGSMVMAGAYAAISELVGLEALVGGMRESVPSYRQQHVSTNEVAITAGYEWGRAA